MSKVNLLTYKRTPVLSIVNKQKTPSQHTITHRDTNKEDDSQKLYTFCSSQQKQNGQTIEDLRDVSRGRKISFNNTKCKVYQPLSKSKGKTASQVNIHRQRKKQLSNFSMTNNSAIINSSVIVERRKTDKPSARELAKENDDNRINISINLSRNCFNEPTNKENKLQINNLLQEKNSNQKKILFQPNFNKQNKGENNEGKKMIVMSQQDLQNFTKKQASDKIKLQQKIQQLQSNIKQFEEKQSEWKLFKKDSQQYIKYLLKEKDEVLNRYQDLQQQVRSLKNDKQYHQMAKEQYRCTINQQEAEIHQHKRQINNYKEQIERLNNQLDKQAAENQNNDVCTSLQLLQIESSHLKKQLQISQKHRSNRNSQRFELQNLQKQLQDLKIANQILSSEMKETYIFKIKCDVFEKTQQQSNNTITRLIQENQSLRNKLRDKYKSVKFQQSEVGDFQFRLDTSPHSPSEVEVVWKRDFQQEKDHCSKSSRVQDYFDHDFFSGFSRQKI